MAHQNRPQSITLSADDLLMALPRSIPLLDIVPPQPALAFSSNADRDFPSARDNRHFSNNRGT